MYVQKPGHPLGGVVNLDYPVDYFLTGFRRTLSSRGVVMRPLVWLGIILVVLWAVLWLGLKMASGLIHLLFIAGLVFVVWGLVKRGVRAVT